MIKICHMTSAHESSDVRIFEKECTSLAQIKGYEVFLVARGNSFDKNGVKVIGIGRDKIGRITRILKISKLIYEKALSLDADIYHVHDPELLKYAVKLKKHNKKVIFDSHENHSEQIKHKYYIPRCLRNVASKLYKIRETKVCKQIDAVIFPCKMNGKHPFEGRCNTVAFINNTPKLEEFYNKYDEKRMPNNSVCYVGGLSYARGITHLIRACNKSKVRLILAGRFQPSAYEEEVRQQEDFENVDYRGVCSREDVQKIYTEASIGASTLLPVGQYYKAENLPTKVYEYMSMGLPVIVSDYPYAQEIMGKYQCGLLVNPENEQAIADAINYLITNKEDADKMGKNGRKAIKLDLTWEIEQNKLYRLYEKVVQK